MKMKLQRDEPGHEDMLICQSNEAQHPPSDTIHTLGRRQSAEG